MATLSECVECTSKRTERGDAESQEREMGTCDVEKTSIMDRDRDRDQDQDQDQGKGGTDSDADDDTEVHSSMSSLSVEKRDWVGGGGAAMELERSADLVDLVDLVDHLAEFYASQSGLSLDLRGGDADIDDADIDDAVTDDEDCGSSPGSGHSCSPGRHDSADAMSAAAELSSVMRELEDELSREHTVDAASFRHSYGRERHGRGEERGRRARLFDRATSTTTGADEMDDGDGGGSDDCGGRGRPCDNAVVAAGGRLPWRVEVIEGLGWEEEIDEVSVALHDDRDHDHDHDHDHDARESSADDYRWQSLQSSTGHVETATPEEAKHENRRSIRNQQPFAYPCFAVIDTFVLAPNPASSAHDIADQTNDHLNATHKRHSPDTA